MPRHFPNDLLRRPANESVRLIALRRLDEVVRARARLEDATDTEALHDFRVALRRLRSCLRTFRLELGSDVGRRLERRLRRFARAAGESRDLEVHLQWLDGQLPHLDAAEAEVARQLSETLRDRKAEADRRLQRRLQRRFAATAARLDDRLGTYQVRLSLRDDRRLPAAYVIGRRAAHLHEQLRRALAKVETVHDIRPAHEARIAAKHLRYLLEPAEDAFAGATQGLAAVRRLQDVLGELHDSQVLLGELDAFADESGGAMLNGMVALAQRVEARAVAAFADLRPAERDGGGPTLAERLGDIVTRLLGSGLPQEIERKYLLSALPPRAAGVPALEIEQGWLPGSAILERLRRVRSGAGETYYRTIKLGDGLARTEIEETVTPAFFAELWPFTADRRITKRRYRIADPVTELTWEIDEFDGRDLVLAEVELPSATAGVEPPAWLAPYVVREVTDEEGFTNFELAGRNPERSAAATQPPAFR